MPAYKTPRGGRSSWQYHSPAPGAVAFVPVPMFWGEQPLQRNPRPRRSNPTAFSASTKTKTEETARTVDYSKLSQSELIKLLEQRDKNISSLQQLKTTLEQRLAEESRKLGKVTKQRDKAVTRVTKMAKYVRTIQPQEKVEQRSVTEPIAMSTSQQLQSPPATTPVPDTKPSSTQPQSSHVQCADMDRTTSHRQASTSRSLYETLKLQPDEFTFKRMDKAGSYVSFNTLTHLKCGQPFLTCRQPPTFREGFTRPCPTCQSSTHQQSRLVYCRQCDLVHCLWCLQEKGISIASANSPP